MAQKIKQSVFKLTRDEEDNRVTRSAKRTQQHVLHDATNTQQMPVSFTESPSMLPH